MGGEKPLVTIYSHGNKAKRWIKLFYSVGASKSKNVADSDLRWSQLFSIDLIDPLFTERTD